VLPIAAIALSNWYFSPEQRLSRLADDVSEIGAPEISNDITAAMSAFPSKFGGSTNTYSSCTLLPICYLSIDMRFPMSSEINSSVMYLSATATVRPVIDDAGWLNIFPPKVKWHPVSYTWGVKVLDEEHPNNKRFYSGTFSEIDQVPEIGNRPANTRILIGMASAIEKQLAKE
jgi:hypothetical protein